MRFAFRDALELDDFREASVAPDPEEDEPVEEDELRLVSEPDFLRMRSSTLLLMASTTFEKVADILLQTPAGPSKRKRTGVAPAGGQARARTRAYRRAVHELERFFTSS